VAIGKKAATNIFAVNVHQAKLVLMPCRAASLRSIPTTEGSRYSSNPVTIAAVPIKIPSIVAPSASAHQGSGPTYSAATSNTGTASHNEMGKCTSSGCIGTPNACLGSLIAPLDDSSMTESKAFAFSLPNVIHGQMLPSADRLILWRIINMPMAYLLGEHAPPRSLSESFARLRTKGKQTNGGTPPVDFELVYPCHHFRLARTPLHSMIRQTWPMSAVG
jgi:hypothetical protein